MYLPSNIKRLFTSQNIIYSMRASIDLERQSVCLICDQYISLCKSREMIEFSLCDDLKTVNTLSAFKRKYKNILFKNVVGNHKNDASEKTILSTKMFTCVIL